MDTENSNDIKNIDDGNYSENRGQKRLRGGFMQATKYLNSHLNKGEYIIYRAHLSWIPCFINQIPFMLIGSIVGGIAWGVTDSFLVGSNIVMIATLLGIISQLPAIYRNIVTDIVITNQGLHSKHGLIMVQDDQFTPHNRINDAEIDIDSIAQRVFRYANVSIVTIAGDDNGYEFRKLAKPHVFKQAVRQAGQTYGHCGGYPLEQRGTPEPGNRNRAGSRRQ